MVSPDFFIFWGFSWSFETNPSFTGRGCQPHFQPPTCRTVLSLFVWVITFDLSGMGAPTSSYAAADIALRILWPRKPRHYVKKKSLIFMSQLLYTPLYSACCERFCCFSTFLLSILY
jgi:hypothetical protein